MRVITTVVWEDDDSLRKGTLLGQSECLKNSHQAIVWFFNAVMPDGSVIAVDVFCSICTLT